MATLREMLDAKRTITRDVFTPAIVSPEIVAMATLNKFEAAAYLHREYSAYIDNNGLQNFHPDFYGIISENLRAFDSPSAIKIGYRRGNRLKYGTLGYVRKENNRPYFSRLALKAFFYLQFVPKMKKVALPVVAPHGE